MMEHGDAEDTILIIGATGFAGGALARELRSRSKPVRAMVRPDTDSDPSVLREIGVELVEGDITNREDVARACEGVAKAYNFASPFRSAKPSDQYFWDVNVGGVDHLVCAAQKHGLERFVHCSTIGVHGDVQEIPCHEESLLNPGDVYQETKVEGEKVVQEAFDDGARGVIMRPSSMYGPGDTRMLKLFRMVHNGVFVMFGSGEVWFHPAYIDDLVRGFLLCGKKEEALREAFILAGPEPVYLSELVELVADAVDVEPPRMRFPVKPLMMAAKTCEAVCEPLGIEPPLHERRVGFFTKNRYFTYEKARRVLGYEPQVSHEEGMKRTAQWYFENGYLG